MRIYWRKELGKGRKRQFNFGVEVNFKIELEITKKLRNRGREMENKLKLGKMRIRYDNILVNRKVCSLRHIPTIPRL